MSQLASQAPAYLEGQEVCIVVNVDWFFLSHRKGLANRLRTAGANVTVVAADTGVAHEIRSAGFNFVAMPFERGSIRPGRELRLFFRLAQFMSRSPRDAVFHFVTLKPVLYGGFLARLLRCRAIHGITGAGYLFSLADSGSTLWPIRRLFRAVYAWGLHNPRSITLFQNREDMEEFVTAGIVEQRQVRLVAGSGVRSADYEQAFSATRGATTPVILFASRLLREKGVYDFCEAARILSVRGVSGKFLVAGAIDHNPGALTIEEMAHLQDQGVIEWLGSVSDMLGLFARSVVFVLPTYYREGIPRVLLEACSAGSAVVTTDWPGCRDVIVHGETGLLVPPKDPEAVADAIERLLSDDELRVTLIQAARRRVLAMFDEEVILPKTLLVYDDLLSL